jgi:methanogenic corrinoid protein MtbC1
LKEIIRKVRASTKNREVVIMVGGDYFIKRPETVKSVGADVFADNGREAVLKATSACKIRGRLVL